MNGFLKEIMIEENKFDLVIWAELFQGNEMISFPRNNLAELFGGMISFPRNNSDSA